MKSFTAAHTTGIYLIRTHISVNLTNIMAPIGSILLAPSPAAGTTYDLTYYVKAAAAGGICCSITHGALTPVDGMFACCP